MPVAHDQRRPGPVGQQRSVTRVDRRLIAKEVALLAPVQGPRSRVVEPQAVGDAVGYRQGATIGADRDLRSRVRRQRERGHDGGAALECREQGPLGLRRAVQRDRLAGQQRGHVEPGCAERLRPELAAKRRVRLGHGEPGIARGPLLTDHRHHARHHHEHQQHPGAQQERAQPPVLDALARRLALGRGLARSHELALQAVHLVRALGAELERRRQPGAPVQIAAVPPACVPLAGGHAQMAVQPPPHAILLEPPPVARPLAQQRLVRELDRPGADGHQPGVGQRGQHRLGVGDAMDLHQRHAAPLGGALTEVGEPQQDLPGHGALALGQPHIGGLGDPRHPAAHPSRRAVRLDAKHAPVPGLPQLEQGGRQQRQGPGFIPDLGDEHVDQAVLDLEPRPGSRPLDHLPELRRVHRTDQGMAAAEQLGELRIGAQPAVEVGPKRAQHERPPLVLARGVHEPIEELAALGLLGARGEQLLELVDRDHDPLLAAQARQDVLRQPAEHALKLGAGVLPGSQQHLSPTGAAGQRPRAERREHAGAQQRGLADSGRAENPDQRPLGQPRDQLGHDPVAPAEEVGVRALERGQALERAQHRPGRWRLGRVGFEAGVMAQDHVLELPQLGARGQAELVAQQRARLPVGGQRVGLAAGAIEREHELGAQALLKRGLGDQAARAERPPRRRAPELARRRSVPSRPAGEALPDVVPRAARPPRRPGRLAVGRATARAPRPAAPTRPPGPRARAGSVPP